MNFLEEIERVQVGFGEHYGDVHRDIHIFERDLAGGRNRDDFSFGKHNLPVVRNPFGTAVRRARSSNWLARV